MRQRIEALVFIPNSEETSYFEPINRWVGSASSKVSLTLHATSRSARQHAIMGNTQNLGNAIGSDPV